MGIPAGLSYYRIQVGLWAMVQERPVRVERRLSAILAADVAGYSRLMHSDEEGTHVKLTALFTDAVNPAIAEHGGRIVKNTGDGTLGGVFKCGRSGSSCGAIPEPHEGTYYRRGGRPRRIAFRVGVDLGDVIVEPMTSLGMALTSRHGSRALQNLAVSASRLPPTIKFEARLGLSSPIWASRTSRTSTAPCGLMLWSGMNPAQRHALSAQGRTRFHRLIFPSLCCLSPTSAVIPSKITSLMV